MCLYSRFITNPKYKSTKKNGGVIPAIHDERVKLVPIGCGNCIECRKQKARNWQVRLHEEVRTKNNGKFITLTFSNDSIGEIYDYIRSKIKPPYEVPDGYNLDNQIATTGTRLWLERWRKHNKKSLRHWLVTELGHQNTENIHLHGIVWTDKDINEIRNTWKYGHIWPTIEQQANNYVNERTVNYIIKYITKQDADHKHYKSIILTSAGIGSNYINRYDSKKNEYNEGNTNETYRTRTGHKIAMPTYWRNKIYSEEQREKLWIEKLNKEERYICGERINIKQDEKIYYNILEYHRKRNKELGYGTDEKDWKQEEYERQCRNIKIATRLAKKKKMPG